MGNNGQQWTTIRGATGICDAVFCWILVILNGNYLQEFSGAYWRQTRIRAMGMIGRRGRGRSRRWGGKRGTNWCKTVIDRGRWHTANCVDFQVCFKKQMFHQSVVAHERIHKQASLQLPRIYLTIAKNLLMKRCHGMISELVRNRWRIKWWLPDFYSLWNLHVGQFYDG